MYSTVYIELGLDWGGQGEGGNSWPGGLREELHRISDFIVEFRLPTPTSPIQCMHLRLVLCLYH